MANYIKPVPPNSYQTIPQARKVLSAIEMAQEITLEHERLYAVATALVSQLTPQGETDPIEPIALRLSEVLEGLLCDVSQQRRLIQCLEAMRETEKDAA